VGSVSDPQSGRNWKRRYFILAEGVISYYEDEFKVQKLTPKGEIELTADSTVAACDEGPDKKKEKQKDKKKSATSADSRADEASAESADGDSSVDSGGSVDSVGIQIVTPGGTLIAAAADRSDQQTWIEALEMEIDKIRLAQEKADVAAAADAAAAAAAGAGAGAGASSNFVKKERRASTVSSTVLPPDLEALSLEDLKENLKIRGIPCEHITNRNELVELLEFATGISTSTLDEFCESENPHRSTQADEDSDGD